MQPVFEDKVKKYTDARDQTICKRLGLTPALLEQWISQYSTDPKVKEVLKNIEDLEDQAIKKHSIKEMHYEIVPALTREVYVQISRKILACIRHETFNQVQETIKREGRAQITNEELDEILDKVGEQKQEGYRAAALKLYGVDIPEGQIAKRYLQKAYLKYSTISSLPVQPGQPVARSKWNEQIQHEQKQHAELLEKIRQGERIAGIEKDPLETAEQDVVTDYSMVPGFIQREKSVISGEDKLRIQPHASSISAVNKML